MEGMEEKGKFFIDREEAFALLDAEHAALGEVEVPAESARGMVLSRDVLCVEGHPPFSRSAMDGYALRAEDAASPGATLELAGTRRAGAGARERLAPGTCVRIMTGAPVPEGADTVAIVEETEEKDGVVVFAKPAEKGMNIRYEGEDIPAGAVAVPKGTCLAPATLGTCALVGATTLKVFRKPEVAVVVTGDEIAEPGTPDPPYGFIRNANGPMLAGLLGEMGIEARYLGIVPDEPEALKAAFERGLSKSDLLIVTGGVSMGRYDYVPGILSELGLSYLFRKVRVKPGKPLHYARGERGRVFGLPGNPVSSLTSFHLFVRPVLKKMMGVEPIRKVYEGELVSEIDADRHRTLIAPCRAAFEGGSFKLDPVELNGSADLPAACTGNALAVVPAGGKALEAGERLEFIMMEKDL